MGHSGLGRLGIAFLEIVEEGGHACEHLGLLLHVLILLFAVGDALEIILCLLVVDLDLELF